MSVRPLIASFLLTFENLVCFLFASITYFEQVLTPREMTCKRYFDTNTFCLPSTKIQIKAKD